MGEGDSRSSDRAPLDDATRLGDVQTSAAGETIVEAQVDSPPPAPLSQNRDFRVFLGGQGVSAFGDAVSFTAVPLLVLALTGSGAAMGLVGVLTTLPDLLFGLPAGALADRLDRRRLMLYADAGRAALTALIPLSVVIGVDTMAVVLLVTAPINLLRVLFMAGFTAAVPNLVERDQIGRATGLIESVLSLSFIVGPAVAGLLVGIIGAAQTLAIDAASFLFSAGALFLIRRPFQAPRDGSVARSRILADVAEGIRYILAERTLRMAIAFWGATSVATAPLVPAVIYFLTIDRGRPEGIVGLVVSGYGVGYLIGSLIAGRLARGRLGLLMAAGNVGTAIALVAFAVGGSVSLEVTGAAGAGICGALVLISYLTLRATIPPDELLGRVGSTARTISLGLQPIGLFVGGLLLDAIGGGRTILLVAGAVVVVTVVATFSATLRHATAGTGRRSA